MSVLAIFQQLRAILGVRKGSQKPGLHPWSPGEDSVHWLSTTQPTLCSLRISSCLTLCTNEGA